MFRGVGGCHWLALNRENIIGRRGGFNLKNEMAGR